MAINTDEATLEDCPTELIKSLMPALRTQTNPLRAPASRAVQKPVKMPPAINATPHPGYPYPPATPFPYYQYPPPYHAAPYPPPRERSASPVARHVVHLPASSPIRFESDITIDKLKEYFDWLIKGFPGKSEQLEECLVTLRSEEILFTTLPEVPTELWKEWKISTGLILLVKTQMKKWEREQGRKRH